jgi:Polyketide cyclase / dehydrase and lipid transport
MAKSYYSVVLDHPADEVWAVIRPFDHYAWAGVESKTIIEDGKAGDQVGAVRRVTYGENVLRQLLLAHSDIDRSYTYSFCATPPFPVRDYQATIRVTPVVADNHSFVEWWATFDCADDERDKWTKHFERQGFAKWLAALCQFMARAGAQNESVRQ